MQVGIVEDNHTPILGLDVWEHVRADPRLLQGTLPWSASALTLTLRSRCVKGSFGETVLASPVTALVCRRTTSSIRTGGQSTFRSGGTWSTGTLSMRTLL